jgi:RNase H-fold protein (predicted Holliday junction resolvase)
VTAPPSGKTIIAIDPGREKCGLAVVDAAGGLLGKSVVPTALVAGALAQHLEEHAASRVIVGDGTGSRDLRATVAERLPNLALDTVPEEHTTERALELWRDVEPPQGWRRLLPRSLRFPRRPIDDFAAWILARDYLERAGAQTPDSGG